MNGNQKDFLEGAEPVKGDFLAGAQPVIEQQAALPPREVAPGREAALGFLGTYLPETPTPVRSLAESARQEMTSPLTLGATALGARPLQMLYGIGKQLYGAGKEIAPVIPKLLQGVPGLASLTPEQVETGAHGLGTFAGLGSQALLPKVGGEVEAAITRARGIPQTAPGLSPEATANLLPAEARVGTQRIFRAAEPSASNVAFREKLAIAAPDLANIERERPLGESGMSGGIRRPDFRLRQAVANIEEYTHDLWNEERMPQINRHREASVGSVQELSGLSEQTLKGVARKMKGQLPTPDKELNLGETDDLLHGVNAYLRNLEGKTPEQQAVARATNPDVEALYDLKHALRSSIDNRLKQPDLHEVGTEAFDRRYGALKKVQDVLRSRYNVAEATGLFDRMRAYGSLHGGIGGHVGAFLGRSPGRLLQTGLESLARSPLEVHPALRMPPIIPPEAPPSPFQPTQQIPFERPVAVPAQFLEGIPLEPTGPLAPQRSLEGIPLEDVKVPPSLTTDWGRLRREFWGPPRRRGE